MTDSSTGQTTRRTVLRLGSAALLVGAAGCLGGDGPAAPVGDSEMPETMDEGMDDGMDEGMDDGMDEGMDDGMDEGMTGAARQFRVRIENVSTETTLEMASGSVAVPLSPGAYVVHTDPGLLFEAGAPASDGLERLAEDGAPDALAASLADVTMGDGMTDGSMDDESMGDGMTDGSMDDESMDDESMDDESMDDESMDDGMTDGSMDDGMAVPHGGSFAVAVGADGPGPIGPGGAYEFAVTAAPGQRLSFATMFVQSNDLFYAPAPEGIALFDGEEPVSGDVTDRVLLWDAGTEVNEPPGSGPNQAPRQSGPDTGDAENGVVRAIADVDDGFSYPETASVLAATITPVDEEMT